jgi:hypothetical protein
MRTTVAGLGGGRDSFRSRESRRSRSRPSRASSAQPFVSQCGAEPPFPLSRCRRRARLVDCAGFDPAPHFIDRQDAPRRYGFDDRVELYAQRAAVREAEREAALNALEPIHRKRVAGAKKLHAAQVRRQKKLLRSLGVPDLSPEEITERSQAKSATVRKALGPSGKEKRGPRRPGALS